MTPEALAHLHARAFTRERPWSAAEFTALLQSPHVFLCARPHAFALGRVVADEAELLTLATDPDRQRQGLGRACLADFLAQSAVRGATRAFLEVASDNGGAIALYRQAGFTLSATRKRYYQRADDTLADALVMARPVA